MRGHISYPQIDVCLCVLYFYFSILYMEVIMRQCSIPTVPI